MAASKRTSAVAGRRPREESRAWPVPVPSRAELATAFAQALDLAEGRRLGHAAGVAYIALKLAQALRLPAEQQRAAFYAALLHDAGAVLASAEVCRLVNISEEAVFRAGPEKSPQQLALEVAPSYSTEVVRLLRAHPEHGARVARDLGLDAAVQEAIAAHHERWDGHGYPLALKGEAIPIVGRLVAAADLIESLIAAEPNALVARRDLLADLAEHGGRALDPELADRARDLARSDAFWLGLSRANLTRDLAAACPDGEAETDDSPAELHLFASVFAELADAKGEHTSSHSDRTATVADLLGDALGFRGGHREMLHIAALVHDVGLLGIPARIIAKPDILSLTEMQTMREHPAYSQLVLEAVPGLEEVAQWVGAHHERPDGKGYPEMVEESAIPLEARIIALADSFVALTSARPYRRALSDEDAQQVLLGGAGTQFDAKLVQLLCSLPADLRFSQTAQRSQRTQ